jgi:hypothetical protein
MCMYLWMKGGWRRLHHEELHNMRASINIIRVIKSRGMKWAGHVASMGGGGGEGNAASNFLWSCADIMKH